MRCRAARLVRPDLRVPAASDGRSRVSPADVDVVFATHLHPDHIAGMITPDGAAVFPRAELVVTAGEHAFWSDESKTAAPPAPLPDWAGSLGAVLAAYGDRLQDPPRRGRDRTGG
ncbi:MAG: MBL fold metallo-hydrolase [Paracoccaceae bacterium]